MASLIYNSFWDDTLRAIIDVDTDSFKVLLTTSAYTEDKDTHLKRSDVTNEISGSGYTAGGNAATFNVTKDTGNDRVDITAGGTTWPTSTLVARKAVYYKSRGGASSADELVCVIDFGSDVSTTNGTLTLNASTLRLQN